MQEYVLCHMKPTVFYCGRDRFVPQDLDMEEEARNIVQTIVARVNPKAERLEVERAPDRPGLLSMCLDQMDEVLKICISRHRAANTLGAVTCLRKAFTGFQRLHLLRQSYKIETSSNSNCGKGEKRRSLEMAPMVVLNLLDMVM